MLKRGLVMKRSETRKGVLKNVAVCLCLLLLAGCASEGTLYHDPNMDFGSIQTVAVLPFRNLTPDDMAAERVRDTFTGMLLSTGAFYVLSTGEVARGVSRAGVTNPTEPSAEEIGRISDVLKVDAVITGTVNEYGAVRSGTATANVVSLSLEMMETQTGRVVWTAASTRGGVTTMDRLFGGGGDPMNKVTVAACNDLIDKLFQ